MIIRIIILVILTAVLFAYFDITPQEVFAAEPVRAFAETVGDFARSAYERIVKPAGIFLRDFFVRDASSAAELVRDMDGV